MPFYLFIILFVLDFNTVKLQILKMIKYVFEILDVSVNIERKLARNPYYVCGLGS